MNLRAPVFGLALVACLCPTLIYGATYYLSPSGDDGNSGRSDTAAWRSFECAFETMREGDELVLLDGVYSAATGTGTIGDWVQPPSGTPFAFTYIHARNPGNVQLIGGISLGMIDSKVSYVKIQGLTVEGASQLYNTSYVVLKDCGFHDTANSVGGVFGIGTNDHMMGNSYNLIEDCWVWGRDRVIAIDYRSDHNVWRRVVVRGDGCNGSGCTGGGNPNVGITVYESTHISLQNVIVLDRILDGGSPYADFAVAQHSASLSFGQNEWLGTLSLNAPDLAYYFEPDHWDLPTTFIMKDCIAWEPALDGIGIRNGVADIQNCTVKVNEPRSDGIGVSATDRPVGVVNSIVTGSGRVAITADTVLYADVSGNWNQEPYGRGSCLAGCLTIDPLADGSIRYLPRVEDYSPLKGTALGGADYGASLVNRYGPDGSIHGDDGFNAVTTNPLWPWPNQDRIQQEMCVNSGITRGFCSRPSLSEYIWTYLGNPMP